MFHVKKKVNSLAGLSILLLSITTMTTVLGSNSNSANSALAQSISSIPSSNDIGGSNNTIATKNQSSKDNNYRNSKVDYLHPHHLLLQHSSNQRLMNIR